MIKNFTVFLFMSIELVLKFFKVKIYFINLHAFMTVFLPIFRLLAIWSYDIPNKRSVFAFWENF